MADPFALLKIPPSFDLDLAQLEKTYLTESAANHPDRFADPIEQADAAERSAALNQAYRQLRDPESRARALLAAQGGTKDQESALPPDLLMEMMEVREDLDDAIQRQDTEALKRHRRWADQQRAGYLDRLAVLFTQAPVDGLEVQRQLNALRYIERMLEQIPD